MSEENENNLEEQPENKQEQKEDSVEKFLVKSMREGKERTPEALICAKLWRAGSADKLTRAIEIAEASENAKNLWPSKFKPDKELLDVLYSVAVALKETAPEKITEQTQKFPYNYYYYIRYCVPWREKRNTENFDKYISPWLTKIPAHIHGKVIDPETFRIYTTRFLCPYCNEELLAYKHIGKETKTVTDFMKDYKEATFETSKHDLCDVIELWPWLKYGGHGNWQGPYKKIPELVVHFFECPKCKNDIILKNERIKGNVEEKPDYVRKVELHLEQFKWLKLEETNTLPKNVYAAYFWDASVFLSQVGFRELKNMFLMWANPLVSKLEVEISQHVSKNVWDQYFKEQRDSENDKV